MSSSRVSQEEGDVLVLVVGDRRIVLHHVDVVVRRRHGGQRLPIARPVTRLLRPSPWRLLRPLLSWRLCWRFINQFWVDVNSDLGRLGCVNTLPELRGNKKAGFTQHIARSLVQPCIYVILFATKSKIEL